MRIYDAGFAAALSAAREGGIVPAVFFWVLARDRDSGAVVPMGLWSGQDDLTLEVEMPDGRVESRSYFGGCGLSVEGLQQVADLTDNPVTVSLSQIADAAQQLARGYDLRLSYCEIHVTTLTGGAFTAPPQLEWVGVVDEGPIATPAAGGEGGISLSVRSELMAMLTAINPAKSSDAHQKRRNPVDRFCEYAGTVGSWTIQGYKK